MSNKDDISQIKKYLEGGLDAHAMHQLEREAQDDPFLAEAMEGFELSGTDPQAALDDLDARLQQRIAPAKTRRLIPWMAISAAASVVLILTIAYLFWPSGKEAKQFTASNVTLAKSAPSDLPQATKSDTTVIEEKQEIAANNPAMASQRYVPFKVKPDNAVTQADEEVRIDEPVGNADTKQVAESSLRVAGQSRDTSAFANRMSMAKTVTPANSAGYMYNYNQTSRQTDTSLFVRKAASAAAPIPMRFDTSKMKEIVIGYGTKKPATGNPATQNTVLQGKVEGANVTTPEHIHGTVSDIVGVPLPGVLVMVPGTRNGTQTDAQGRFTIAATEGQVLDIRTIGYDNKQVKASTSADNNISLKPNNAALAEVVITSYQQIKPDKHAHPREGWDNFNNYLKAHAIAADGEPEGTVELSFKVDAKGALKEFKVTKGLSENQNQEAISLIKNTAPWVGETDGATKTIKLKIHFGKKP